MKTINCTPTWQAALRIYLTGLEHGTPEGKEIARKGLMDMANAAQLAVELQKQNKELKTALNPSGGYIVTFTDDSFGDQIVDKYEVFVDDDDNLTTANKRFEELKKADNVDTVQLCKIIDSSEAHHIID